MKLCEGRVAIVTGAGRGLGRAHALKLASHGAAVVVNDLGSEASGVGSDPSPAAAVVAEIEAAGGRAVVDGSDAASWEGAAEMVRKAVEELGRLDIVVNNAGILRDRMLVNMTEEEWDSVTRVHLKSTFAVTRHAADHWRSLAKRGEVPDARVINTTSHSGLYCNVGQANYAAAKAGIASFSIVAARELQRYGVTVNAIAPRATTRMTQGLREWNEEQLRMRDPDWVAALVTWLASPESKEVSGRVFEAWGYGFTVAESWQHGATAEASLDPTEIGARILDVHRRSRKNAGIDLGEELDP
ncbi:NAD(P)-dependent dehydrogenase, short-chain alcohol dehydrogenase family [Tistlia consotensis]|uniref:NAD(P)-dependent dehydrogenase, short-chain alcohol dehydrogenase family n=1 Tax=Tistlia consotensis USBA 355 TaxID=560819 RepID=A0A1Y6CI86_9PROT|nr:SDR family NAD(P)-dependent oxidoreductase [Tistlia consotensis]SMF65886.1 NAD(P)-dependent dehydrogenase, short-chain alcohol dehydrogenase family [Tistlia consotensis USBA 355]SNS02989.1 NAD(P)-dependent dehydrogenase, short-chain alcohol dehydrogenase family [Tistlia consotensis]